MSAGDRAAGRSPITGDEAGAGDHLLDGLNSGNGLLGERETQSNSSEQLAINVDRASAHALGDACLGEGTTTEAGKNDRLLWTGIRQDAEDLNLEFFDFSSAENSAAYAVHAGKHVLKGKEGLSRSQKRGNTECQPDSQTEHWEFQPRFRTLTHISYCGPSGMDAPSHRDSVIN